MLSEYFSFLENIMDNKSQYLYDIVEQDQSSDNMSYYSILIMPINFYKSSDPNTNDLIFKSLYGSNLITINKNAFERLSDIYKHVDDKLVLLDKYPLNPENINENSVKITKGFLIEQFAYSDKNIRVSDIIRTTLLNMLEGSYTENDVISLCLRLNNKTKFDASIDMDFVNKNTERYAVIRYNDLFFLILKKPNINNIIENLASNDNVLILCEYDYIPIYGKIEVIYVK